MCLYWDSSFSSRSKGIDAVNWQLLDGMKEECMDDSGFNLANPRVDLQIHNDQGLGFGILWFHPADQSGRLSSVFFRLQNV